MSSPARKNQPRRRSPVRICTFDRIIDIPLTRTDILCQLVMNIYTGKGSHLPWFPSFRHSCMAKEYKNQTMRKAKPSSQSVNHVCCRHGIFTYWKQTPNPIYVLDITFLHPLQVGFCQSSSRGIRWMISSPLRVFLSFVSDLTASNLRVRLQYYKNYFNKTISINMIDSIKILLLST